MNKKDKIQAEALAAILPLKRAGAGITMGGGKTLLGLKYLEHYYNKGARKFLVVVPKNSIKQSWFKDAADFNLSYLLNHITFCTYLAISANKITEQQDVVVLDECHSLLFSHEVYLKTFTGPILGLSGTPPRYANSEKGIMVNRYCPIAYRYTTDEAVDNELLNDYRIMVHMLDLEDRPTVPVQMKDGRSFNTSELKTYNYWTERVDNATSQKNKQVASIMRMKAMMTFPSKEEFANVLFNNIDEKVLLFCNTQEQADKLCGFSYHSKNPDSMENLQLFSNGTILKMTCVEQLNEGINIPKLRQGIIIHSYGNEKKASQKIGRLLRLNPNDCATAHILCYRNTVDERWVENALKDFDESKITYC